MLSPTITAVAVQPNCLQTQSHTGARAFLPAQPLVKLMRSSQLTPLWKQDLHLEFGNSIQFYGQYLSHSRYRRHNFDLELGLTSLFNWQYLSSSRYSQHQPSWQLFLSQGKPNRFERLTQCQKYFVRSTKTERLTITVLLYLKKLSSSCSSSPEYPILALATKWWGKNLPPVESTKQAPHNKADFWDKKKTTKSKKT